MSKAVQEMLDIICDIKNYIVGEKIYSVTEKKSVLNKIPPSNSDFFNKIAAELKKIQSEASECYKCIRSRHRLNIVSGFGNILSEIMIIGDIPGKKDDFTGKCFSGEDGELLLKMLDAVQLNIDKVYLTTFIKCYSEHDTKINLTKCINIIKKQIEIINPKVILCLGEIPVEIFFNENLILPDIRGKILSSDIFPDIKIIYTFHPSELIKNPSLKTLSWKDIQVFRDLYKSICVKIY